MKIILLALLAISLSACNNKATKAKGEKNTIGVFKVPASGSVNFTFEFDTKRMIMFKTNMSWDEMKRMRVKQDANGMPISSVMLIRPSDGHYVGSHFGAGTSFSPEKEGVSEFEITNQSNEDLEVTVYWE